MDVLYLAAGSQKWGMGHLRRSLELIDELRLRKNKVFSAAVIPDDRDSRLSGTVKGYDRYVAGLDELGDIPAEGIVVDVHTDFQPGVLRWLKKRHCPAAALDWYFRKDQAVASTINLRGGVAPLKYALIRKEFYALRRISQNQKEYDAVVVFGGKDARGYLDKLLEIFSGGAFYQNKKIVMIAGPMAEGKILQWIGRKKGPVRVMKNPGNLAAFMARAKVGITNGGTTLMEFTMLGVPTIVFPQSRQETNFIPAFLRQGGSLRGDLRLESLKRQLYS